jgi:hypothetical protein
MAKKLLAVSQGPLIIRTWLAAYLPYFTQPTPFVLTQKILLAKLRSPASFIKRFLRLPERFFLFSSSIRK